MIRSTLLALLVTATPVPVPSPWVGSATIDNGTRFGALGAPAVVACNRGSVVGISEWTTNPTWMEYTPPQYGRDFVVEHARQGDDIVHVDFTTAQRIHIGSSCPRLAW